MRLLVDAHCFDYSTSEGINTYIRGIYQVMPKIAPDINFYFVGHEIEKIQGIFGSGTNIKYIQLRKHNKVKRLLTEIPQIVKNHNIDIGHFQYTAPLIKNCKTIVTLHDILFKDYPHLFPLSYRISKDILFRISAKRADLLLTVSDYSRKRIAHHYKIPEENIHVTPNAVSEDFFNISNEHALQFVQKQGLEKYILYVSRIEPRKNQLALLKAYNELNLANRNFHLVFIGRHTITTNEFNEYLSNLSPYTKSHIHIYNNVNYQDLKLWYKGCSLFVFPAIAEGFGIPPIEAGAAGVPCICNNATAMGDFKFFRKNLIDMTDIECLKKKILENINSPISNDEIADISKKIHECYNWETIAINLYNLIKNMR